MVADSTVLKVYQTGPVTVVGFDGKEVPDDYRIADYRDQLTNLVKTYNCRILAFDLSGVKLIPSGMLGLLASLCKLDVEVHLYNPSQDVREVLEVTKLDQLVTLKDVEI